MSYIPEELRQRVREAANNQCGYCKSLQKYVLGLSTGQKLEKDRGRGFDRN